MYSEMQTYSKEIVSVLVVVLAAFVNRALRIRPKLVYSVRHSFNFVVDQPITNEAGDVVQSQQIIRTASIYSENYGLSSAKNVEFTFNWKPAIFNVTPARHFTEHNSPQGRFTIRFDSLSPKESVAIEMLAINQELPYLSAARSDDTEGKLIQTTLQRKYSKYTYVTVIYLMLAGLASSVYWTIYLLQLLART